MAGGTGGLRDPDLGVAVLYIRGHRRGDHGLVRRQPESLARIYGAGLLRACRVLRHRGIRLRSSDEETWPAICAGVSGGGSAGGVLRTGVRGLLRAPDQNLL